MPRAAAPKPNMAAATSGEAISGSSATPCGDRAGAGADRKSREDVQGRRHFGESDQRLSGRRSLCRRRRRSAARCRCRSSPFHRSRPARCRNSGPPGRRWSGCSRRHSRRRCPRRSAIVAREKELLELYRDPELVTEIEREGALIGRVAGHHDGEVTEPVAGEAVSLGSVLVIRRTWSVEGSNRPKLGSTSIAPA